MVDLVERPANVKNYNGMREWLDQVQAIGELRRVTGASWQEDIGRIAEMLTHSDGAPAVICDEITPKAEAPNTLLLTGEASD